MRKRGFIALVITGTFLVSMFTGCAAPPQLTYKDDVEESSVSSAPEQQADISDKDALDEFLRAALSIQKEALENWEYHYDDITGDGNNEAICSSSFDDSWQGRVIVVTADDGTFKMIGGDEIPQGKYATDIAFENGILAVTAKTGGTGIQETYTYFYTYSDSAMINVLDGLCMEEIQSIPGHPEADVHEEGIMDGSLSDFIYTRVSYDSDGNGTVVDMLQYVYQPETLGYDISDVVDATEGQQNAGLTAYNLSDLANGDTVGGFTIDKIRYDSDTASFTLKGKAEVTGDLIEDMMYGGYMLYIPAFEDFAINIPWSSGDFAFSPRYITITNSAGLAAAVGQEVLDALSNGGTAPSVHFVIENIGVSLKDGSEGGAWATVIY